MVGSPPPLRAAIRAELASPSTALASNAAPVLEHVPFELDPASASIASSSPAAHQLTLDNRHRTNAYKNMVTAPETAQSAVQGTPQQERLNVLLAQLTKEDEAKVYEDFSVLTQVISSLAEPAERTRHERLLHALMSGNSLDLHAVEQCAALVQRPVERMWVSLSYLALVHQVQRVASPLSATQVSSRHPQSLVPAKPVERLSRADAPLPLPSEPKSTTGASTARLEDLAQTFFPVECGHSPLAETRLHAVTSALWTKAEAKIHAEGQKYKPLRSGHYLEPMVYAALVHQEIVQAVALLYPKFTYAQRQLCAQDMTDIGAVLVDKAIHSGLNKWSRFSVSAEDTKNILDRQFQVFGCEAIGDLGRIQNHLATQFGKTYARAVQMGLELTHWVAHYASQVQVDPKPAPPGMPIQLFKQALLNAQGKFSYEKTRALQNKLASRFNLKKNDCQFEEVAHALVQS
jgi:hypothetical protein